MSAIVSSGIVLMVPILWAALGEVIVESGGVLNIGIEGVMIFGAFAAAVVLNATHSASLSTLVALPTGAACGVVLAVLYVYRAANQIAAGLMFNLFALGATTILTERYLTQAIAGDVTSTSISIPLLADLPVVGSTVFAQPLAVYAVIGAAVIVYLVLRHTWFGLNLKAVGQRPLVAEVVGIDVLRLRAIALTAGCMLGALGGASIVVNQSGVFLPGITSGQGFIALAIVVLGRFNPLLLIGAGLLFGVSTSFQFQAQTVSMLEAVPTQFWTALPYILTIAVVVVAKEALYPESIGLPYIRPNDARSRLWHL
jgi:simple sugar transport system permease protein